MGLLPWLLPPVSQRFLDDFHGDLLSLGGSHDDAVRAGLDVIFLQTLSHDGDGVVFVFAGVPAVVYQEVGNPILIVPCESGEEKRFSAEDGHVASKKNCLVAALCQNDLASTM